MPSEEMTGLTSHAHVIHAGEDGCAHCGVVDCEARYQSFLALDYTYPEYMAVHHLVVPAYMLQHNAYAADVVEETARFVLSHLTSPVTDHDRAAIRTLRRKVDRVVREDPPPLGLEWLATVADVETSSAEAYRHSVREWAGAVARLAGRIPSAHGGGHGRHRNRNESR